MARAIKAIINTKALAHNLAIVRKKAPKQKVMAMIKANGYGHGLVAVAKALENADALGVARLEEALTLRDNGIKNRIVLMGGFFHGEELSLIQQYDLEMVIHHEAQLEALSAQKNQSMQSIPTWIKINTGMNRLGFNAKEALRIFESLKKLKNIQHEGFMTHFAESENNISDATQQQMDLFFKTVGELPGAKCLANSAAILGVLDSHADWVRPGIMLYGVSPYPHQTGQDHGLMPVMTLESILIAIHDVPKGERVGYGGHYQCDKETRVGVVAAGYGDGYPRNMPTGTPVLVNGQEVPVVGRVSMDMLTVDLSDVSANVGDKVTFWGPLLPVERIAAKLGTIPYELLTGLSMRVSVEWV